MFNVSVTNFKGCRSARFGVSPIALIVGHNSAGKSSILYPVACALVGQSKVFGLTKDAEKTLVPYTGAKEAVVSISGEDWGSTMTWPGGKATSKGSGARVSLYAAGLASLLDVTGAARAEALARYVNANPTADDWMAACKDSIIPEARAKEVWKRLEEVGGSFDAVFNTEKEAGAQMKGEWRAVTGATHGKDVAEKWRADGAIVTDAGPEADAATAERAVQEAQAALENELAKGGADEAERARLNAILIPEAKVKEAKALAETDMKRWQEEMEAAETRLKKIPVATKEPPSCPHCSGNLLITIEGHDYKVAKAGHWDAAEYDRVKKMEEDAQSQFNHTTRKYTDACNLAQAAEADLKKIADARAKLASMGDGKPGDVAGARQRVADAQKVLRATLATGKAQAIHQRVLVQANVVHLLAPDGVRATVMKRSLANFNSRTRELCALAAWQQVLVTDDLDFTYGGKPYAMMADNEKFRVRVILQLAQALIDKSQAVVIDGAEILDNRGREGLIMLLVEKEFQAIVAMTMPPEKAPDLEKMGVGVTIIMTNGEASPMGAKAA